MISEHKVDDSSPNGQFKIKGFKSFKDRNAFGGGLLFYVEKLNCRSLEICLLNTFIKTTIRTYAHKLKKILLLELTFINWKWLILGTYKPACQNESTYVSENQKLLRYYGISRELTGNINFENEKAVKR